MRVQNISQNNYQNNNQNKNIGFKQSHILKVNGLTRSCDGLCDGVENAFVRGIEDTLRKKGILFHPQRNVVAQKMVEGGSELVVMDARDTQRFINAPTADEAGEVIREILSSASRSETSWSQLA